MKNVHFPLYFLLCAAPIAIMVSSTQAADAPVNAQTAKTRTVRDSNDLRTLEIATNCDETVTQFFARQKLVLVDNANTAGKFWSVPQIINGDASKIFVSYPLQNDQGFRLYRYGDYFQLEKTAPAVAALFKDDLKLNWKNTMLILAPDETGGEDSLDKKARLVGRIFIKDAAKWRPEMDAELLKYQVAK